MENNLNSLKIANSDNKIIQTNHQLPDTIASNNVNKLASFVELDLQAPLIQSLTHLEFIKPTTIQSLSIPIILDGHDLLANAPTGTGKTLAFVVPLIEHLLNFPKRSNLRSIIISPTRDLALQTYQVIQKIIVNLNTAYLPTTALITGSQVQEEQEEILDTYLDILVATPGRIASYFKQQKIDGSNVEMLIYDEGDRILEMGFGEDAYLISDNCPNRINTLIFSATLDSGLIKKFADDVLDNPVYLNPQVSRAECKKINQYYYHADSVEHKQKLLFRYITENNINKVLVFVKKREQVRPLSDHLRLRGLRATFLEGNMSQEQRSRALTYLADGTVNILVTTDLAARGLDIPDIDLVVNYDLPYNGDTYVHRIGRTGRNQKKGLAISLVENHDYRNLGKAMRYQNDFFKARVIKGLEPRTSANLADFHGKSKNKKNKLQPIKVKPRIKDRVRNLKNKGKPKNKLS